MFKETKKTISRKFSGFAAGKESLDIFDSILPYYFLIKAFGMAPYKIIGVQGKRKFVSTFFQHVISIVIITILFTMFVIGFPQRDAFIEKYFEEVEGAIEGIQTSTNIALTLGQFLSSLYYHRTYMNLFTKMGHIDDFFPSLGRWVDYAHIRKRVLLIVVIWVLLSLMQTAFDYFFLFRGQFLLYWTVYWIPYFISAVTETGLLVNLIGLRHRYEILNKHVEEIINEPVLIRKDKIIEVSTVSDRKKFLTDGLRRTKYIHWHLTDIGIEIDGIFNFSMLLMITNTFIAIVSSSYNAWIRVKISKSFLEFLDNVFGLINYCVTAVIRLLIIIYNYNMAKYESNALVHMMHKVNLDTPKLIETLESIYLQVFHHKLEFSACGLFPLDSTLFFSMAAGVGTYLVILINFNTSESNDAPPDN